MEDVTVLEQQRQGGDLLRAQLKQRANRVKSKLKALLKKLDETQTGLMRTDAFVMLLESHSIKLPSKGIQKLRADCGKESDKVDYI